ncbi:MAG: DUF3500 domain-containing protein [Fibrella sp.]|nr:DUF3500 domain-containing protein [Armatimonadota bacterium]
MTTRRFWLPIVPAIGASTLIIFAAGNAITAGAQSPRPAPSVSPITKVKTTPTVVREGAGLPGAAKAFLSSLPPPLRAKAVFPFDAEERLVWHYVPMARRGVTVGEMDGKQRATAMELLRTALSEAGYKKVETIRALETVLQEIENDTSGSNRNPDRYYFTVFGEPSARGAWALRYEGHHLSLHWTILDGRVVASTPQFLGANPARVGRRSSATGPAEGTNPLSGEESLARAFLRSLTVAQRTKAIVGDTAPNDILTGVRRRVEAGEDTGVTFAELDAKQRGLLLSLIREHAAVQTDAVATRRLDAIRKAGLDNVRFAWMGGIESGQGHYYRIQGKTFLIEYDNTQNRANHIHTVWRDLRGDFGEDALTEHYRQFPPGTTSGQSHGHDHPHR